MVFLQRKKDASGEPIDAALVQFLEAQETQAELLHSIQQVRRVRVHTLWRPLGGGSCGKQRTHGQRHSRGLKCAAGWARASAVRHARRRRCALS